MEQIISTYDTLGIEENLPDRFIQVKLDNHYYDYDAIVMLMDDDIREELHNSLDLPVTAQQFLDAYIVKHFEKYQKDFEL